MSEEFHKRQSRHILGNFQRGDAETQRRGVWGCKDLYPFVALSQRGFNARRCKGADDVKVLELLNHIETLKNAQPLQVHVI